MSSRSILISVRQLKKNTGAKRYVENLIHELMLHDHKITIVCEKIDPEIKKKFPGIKIISIYRLPLTKILKRLAFNLFTQVLTKKGRYDLHISHGDAETKDLLFLHNSARLEKDRLKDSIHFEKSNKDIIDWQDRLIGGKKFSKLITNSNILKNDIHSRYHIDKEKIQVIYPGTDVSSFRAKTKNRNQTQTAVSEESKFNVGLVTSGNLPKRNISFFLEVAEILIANRGIKSNFIITGTKNELLRVQEVISRKGISEFFELIPFVDDVGYIYSRIDLFCLPAVLEEFGCGVIEALSVGIPVLISDQVGAGELLQKAKIPKVLALDDPREWAEYIHQISRYSAHERRSLAAECKAFSENFGLDQFGYKVRRVIAECN